MEFVLRDALVQVVQLAEHVADDGIAPAGQLLPMRPRLAAHDFGLLRQHDAELAHQPTDAVDQRGVRVST